MRIDNASIPVQPARRPAPPERPVQEDVRAVLSADELDYFTELAKMGPLTYGRRGASTASHAPPAALGQRIDVRA